jgi:hypothetical protein
LKLQGTAGFELRHPLIQPFHVFHRDALRVRFSVAGFLPGRRGQFSHEIDQPPLRLRHDGFCLLTQSSDAQRAERSVQFIHRAERMDTRVGFGETAAEQQIGLALVSFAGGDGHGVGMTNDE